MKAGVLIISNDKTVFDFVKPKLVLLRNNDTVYESDYADAEDCILKVNPQVVILHCGYDLDAFAGLAKKISIPVIACFDELDTEYLLTACDCGISDFFTKKSSSEEILVRLMFLLKNRIVKEKQDIGQDILKENNIMDVDGFYLDPLKVYPYFLSRYDYGTFVIISSMSEKMRAGISGSLRESDVKACGYGNIYYIFMPDTDIDGAVTVIRKIISATGAKDFHAGVCSHYANKEFPVLNNILENALNVAVGSKKEYIIIDENLTPAGNWIEKINTNKKNFKLFKQEFNKMLEQVLTPVFYQMQAKYETKLVNAKIYHSITPEVSEFKIAGEYFDSVFRLKSAGFSAVNIEIIHNTKEKRVTIDINDLEAKTLEVLLEEFIEEHKMYMEELC